MKRLAVIALVLMVSLALMTGCDGGAASNKGVDANQAKAAGGGGVATIDLDKIAKGMGWFDDMQRKVGAAEQELALKVDSLRTELETRLRDEQRRMGDKPTQEQQDRLAAMQLVAQRQLQEAQAQSQLQAQQTRQQVISQYRDLVRPVARRVAEQKGFTVIVLPTDAIFWSDPATDLTDTVMDELQRTGVKLSSETQPDAVIGINSQPTPQTTPSTP